MNTSPLDWKLAKNHLPTVDQVIRLFSAVIVDNRLHESFKAACAVRLPSGNCKPDPGREMRLFRDRFSEEDVISFAVQYVRGGVMPMVVQWTLEALTSSKIIIKIDPFVESWQIEYFLNPSAAEFVCNRNLIKNILFGFEYIVENY